MSLLDQLGNIGSEVGRAAKWQGKDKNRFYIAVEKALELFDLTLRDKRRFGKLHEIIIAKEVFADAVLGGHEYKSFLPDLERYFMPFAMLANSRKVCVPRKNRSSPFGRGLASSH